VNAIPGQEESPKGFWGEIYYKKNVNKINCGMIIYSTSIIKRPFYNGSQMSFRICHPGRSEGSGFFGRDAPSGMTGIRFFFWETTISIGF
jgi:hypothetical protein